MCTMCSVSRMWKVVTTALLVSVVAEAEASMGSNLQRLSRAHFQFTLDLYRNLLDEPGGRHNIVFSPYSITNVLSKLFLGAGTNSNTSRQLRHVLHYDDLSSYEVHSAFRRVLENFEDPYYNDTVYLANGVFKQAGVVVSSFYERALEEFYMTRLDEVDFSRNEATARSFINRWVRLHTGDRISQLLSHPLDANTKLVLVNAVVMKVRWLFKFDKAQTFTKGLFYVDSHRRFEVAMMVGKFKLPIGYSEDMECRVLEIPFKDRRISLFVLLPDDLDRGLASLELNLSADSIKALFSTLKDEVVNIRLPRFSVSRTTDLVSALVNMGVSDIFSTYADFSGMSEERGLRVSGIAHKTILELQEGGSIDEEPDPPSVERVGTFGDKYFEVDHPFIFFIWDYRSGIVLFMGRVADVFPLT